MNIDEINKLFQYHHILPLTNRGTAHERTAQEKLGDLLQNAKLNDAAWYKEYHRLYNLTHE